MTFFHGQGTRTCGTEQEGLSVEGQPTACQWGGGGGEGVGGLPSEQV